MPLIIRFYRLSDQLKAYFLEAILLKYRNNRKSQKIRHQLLTVAFFLLLRCLQMSAISFTNQSDFARLIHFDVMFFFRSPSYLNATTIFYGFETLVLFRLIYFSVSGCPAQRRLLSLTENVLYGRQPNGYFLTMWTSSSSSFQKRGTQRLPVTVDRLVKRATFRFLLLIRYGMLGTMVFQSYIHIFSFTFIAADWRYFCTSFSGLVSMHFSVLSGLWMDFLAMTLWTVNGLATTVVVAFSRIFFIKLAQVNGLIAHKNGGGSSEVSVNSSVLPAFYRHHTTTLVDIASAANAYFGGILLAILALSSPLSTYILVGLILGRFNQMATGVFLNFLQFQFVALCFLHLVAAMYENRLHKCAPRLLHFSAVLSLQAERKIYHQNGDHNRRSVEFKISGSSCTGHRCRCHLEAARSQLKLDCYIAKIHVTKRYGIHYGSFGGLITVGSFSKFLIIFSEFIIYWFRIYLREKRMGIDR
ncbi:hypothetical protein TYRP_003570 [Tyrophagus putrescentiae]|nr:hypothetical protein TYRP_003570 [Tyrophagus putrescentiae]